MGGGGVGWLYVATCGGYHRIGWSRAPLEALTAMRAACPFPVDLVGVRESSRDEQAAILDRLQVLHGEWVTLNRVELAGLGVGPIPADARWEAPAASMTTATTRQVEFTVRAGLVDRLYREAADRRVHLSRVVERGLRSGLPIVELQATVVTAPVRRLRARLPFDVCSDLALRAAAAGVSRRQVVEQVLDRMYPRVRGPGWDPNRPPSEP